MSLKAGIAAPVADRWSPQITIGTPVLIPEDYVADLSVRLALYRRLADIEDEQEIEAFGAELVDRFGPLPEEVEHLLKIVAIKSLCRRANVERIETGPKGAVLSFRDNTFANPEGLIALHRQAGRGGAGAARPEGGAVLRLGEAGPAAARHHGGAAQPGAHRRAGQGGVGRDLTVRQGDSDGVWSIGHRFTSTVGYSEGSKCGLGKGAVHAYRRCCVGFRARFFVDCRPRCRSRLPMVRKAPAAVVAMYNWTGFYAGAHVGYGWGDTDTNIGLTDAAEFCKALRRSASSRCATPTTVTVTSLAGNSATISRPVRGCSASRPTSRRQASRAPAR